MSDVAASRLPSLEQQHDLLLQVCLPQMSSCKFAKIEMLSEACLLASW